MNELIKITEKNGHKVVSARELHAMLEVKKKFADWFKYRVEKYGLVEGQDYVAVSKNLENGFASQKRETKRGGQNAIEYALTLEAAKELAMVEGNVKGREVRQYFIKIEKAYKQAVSTTAIPSLIEHTSRTFQVENVKTANGIIWRRSDTVAIADYHRWIAKLLTGKNPSQLVKEAKSEKVPYKSRTSGREVMRYKHPESACAASVSDDLISRGYLMEQIEPVVLKMKDAFKGLIELGLTPKELAA